MDTPTPPPAGEKLRPEGAVHRRVLSATAIAAVAISSSAAAASGVTAPPPRALTTHAPTGSHASSRPSKADWQKIQAAARLRDLALAPHRTAHFRAFAADLGLRELASIHPIAPGNCVTAVIYLYNNLRDLADAYPNENWTPLRRAVATEPSIQACAPRQSTSVTRRSQH